jgi:hypothetical protein
MAGNRPKGAADEQTPEQIPDSEKRLVATIASTDLCCACQRSGEKQDEHADAAVAASGIVTGDRTPSTFESDSDEAATVP